MKKLIGICLAIVLAVSVFCPVVQADTQNQYNGTVYYFDAVNGSNTNDGLSPSTAFKTLTKIAVLDLQPGDAVLLKRGDVYTTPINVTKSGTAGNPITFSCYGDESKDLPMITRQFATPAIHIKTQSYIVIDSLHVVMTFTGTSAVAGIKVESADGKTSYNNVIKNCIVEGKEENWSDSIGSGISGIQVEALNYWGFFNGVTIENNQIYNCKGVGIDVNGCHGGSNADGSSNSSSGKNIIVRNNYLYNIGKDGIRINNCNSPLIEYNTCGRSHSYAKTSWHVAMWPFACYNAMFQFNESYETQTTYDGQGFDCDYLCYYTTFQYNYSHDNVGGFMLICTEPTASWLKDPTAYNVGSVVRYNISQNDKHNLISLVHHITDTSIYNNTIYAGDGVDHIVHTGNHNDSSKNPINTKFYNNIFYTKKGGFDWKKATGTEFKNNIVYGDNANLYPQNDDTQNVNDNIESSGNIFADPMLVEAGGASLGFESCGVYKLQENSPALGAGLVINDITNTRDFFGNRVSSSEAPNIGAYNGKGIKIILGDSNYDGEISMSDLLSVSKYLAKIYDESKINYKNVDLNQDKKVDAKDALLLKKQILNY